MSGIEGFFPSLFSRNEVLGHKEGHGKEILKRASLSLFGRGVARNRGLLQREQRSEEPLFLALFSLSPLYIYLVSPPLESTRDRNGDDQGKRRAERRLLRRRPVRVSEQGVARGVTGSVRESHFFAFVIFLYPSLE